MTLVALEAEGTPIYARKCAICMSAMLNGMLIHDPEELSFPDISELNFDGAGFSGVAWLYFPKAQPERIRSACKLLAIPVPCPRFATSFI
jgi:hypothetical protein